MSWRKIERMFVERMRVFELVKKAAEKIERMFTLVRLKLF